MPNDTSYDVIIAGLGSMGTAAAYHLAKRGQRVLGLNPHEIPHNLGSHHGRSRMIRQSYYEHPDYVPLLQRAYELWTDLQNQSESPFFHLTGAVYFGSPNGSIVPGAREAAAQHKLPHEFFQDPNEIRSRFPAFRIPPNYAAFYEEQAGYLIPEEAVRTHANLARTLGAHLHTGEPVTAWRATDDGVEITTPRDTYHARHLIITAGAWISDFLRDVDIDFQVTRQVLAWFVPKTDPQTYALGNFPCWFIESESPFGHYGFPIAPGHNGLKLALHKPGPPITPAELHHPQHLPTDEETEALRGFLHDFIPGSDGTLLESTVCLYTNSPDGHFLLGPHPAHQDNVTIACGFSGHGFKFASVIGEITADLATTGATSFPIEFLSPKRFLS
ncbi:MAG: N-methyl-L-tryptophan oxidase [Verrucomicrobiota bacterium]